MVLTNKQLIASSAITVFLFVALSSTAFAEIAIQSRAQAQVAEQLADFKRTAFEMRREADTLKSFTPHNVCIGRATHTAGSPQESP